ncbi:D-aminoacyl-tRNA deacylase [Methanothermococcus sp.]|uniref:D-aminoacyl-tRNA deacylase n=1 Tax=Methanothermococcus sp. TaxID=2614238 RepID=UPI0025E3474B|nr:D-aminoacyl-tRNA deacylase [Methanothermococcus sp.]
MKYLLIYSTKDLAGINIKNNLNNLNLDDLEENIYFFKTDRKLTKLSQKDLPNGYDYYIFLSKHRSESKKPTLTVHTSGNLTIDNSHGGNIEEICPCDGVLNSILLKNIFKYNNLEDYSKFNFEVSSEAVHHGPTDLNVPSVFVEIGSSKKEWEIKEAGEIIAKSIIDTIKSIENKNYNVLDKVVGFGGGHYAPRFTKLVLSNKCYVGYIIPKYAKLSEKVLEQILIKQDFDYILFDWKGLNSEDKKKYIEFFEKNNILWKKVKDLC